MRKHKLFISYAHVDKNTLVVPLVETLRIAGYEAWFDHELVAGKKWAEQLYKAIESCDIFVYAMTPESLSSEWCLWEFSQAAEMKKPIIPVRLQVNIKLPEELEAIQYVDFSEGPTVEAIAKLLRGLMEATAIEAKQVPPAPKNPAGRPAAAPSKLSETDFGEYIKKYLKQSDFPKATISIRKSHFIRFQKAYSKQGKKALIITIELKFDTQFSDFYSTLFNEPAKISKEKNEIIEEGLKTIGWSKGIPSEDGQIRATLSPNYYKMWHLPVEASYCITIAEVLIETLKIILNQNTIYEDDIIKVMPQL